MSHDFTVSVVGAVTQACKGKLVNLWFTCHEELLQIRLASRLRDVSPVGKLART